MFRIYAFKADSSIMCESCFIKLYGFTASAFLDHDNVTDREGNEVVPLYAWNIEADDSCGECGRSLLEF